MEIKLKDFNALLNFNLGHYICSLCGLYVDPRAHRVFQQALECGQDPHLQPVTYVLYFLNNAKRESINISSLLTMITLLPMNPKVFLQNGTTYPVLNLITPENTFNETAYAEYGPPIVSPYFMCK